MTRFFITGCASGIGRRLTERLLSAGHTVFATDINLDGLTSVARELGWPSERCHLARLDVRDADQWNSVFLEAVERLGGVDVAINNAGVMQLYWANETPPPCVHLMVDVNVKGVIFGTQTAATHMIERGSGHIVNVASLAGVAIIKGFSVYCATKFAVRAYSLAAAEEFAPKGVSVSTVCPDAVDTPLLDCEKKDGEEAAMAYHAPKLLTADDVVDTIIEKVLPRKPRIVYIPWTQGALARIGMAFPTLFRPLIPMMERMSRKNQAKHFARKQA